MAVVSFLAEQGVDASKLAPAGHGETNPRAEDPFDPVNRRVEAKLAIQ
jgi:outer membrane protein OmpA-like peptidoglycan-associated protein